jgi:hypothetical protein
MLFLKAASKKRFSGSSLRLTRKTESNKRDRLPGSLSEHKL